MAIGYTEARNLMMQLDWKAKVTTICGSVERIELYHPKRPGKEKRVRIDSGLKLISYCRTIKRIDPITEIMCYDWDGSNEKMI